MIHGVSLDTKHYCFGNFSAPLTPRITVLIFFKSAEAGLLKMSNNFILGVIGANKLPKQ